MERNAAKSQAELVKAEAAAEIARKETEHARSKTEELSDAVKVVEQCAAENISGRVSLRDVYRGVSAGALCQPSTFRWSRQGRRKTSQKYMVC